MLMVALFLSVEVRVAGSGEYRNTNTGRRRRKGYAEDAKKKYKNNSIIQRIFCGTEN
jgi:hypothetical protein